MLGIVTKFGLFGAAGGGIIGLGAGAYYGGIFGAAVGGVSGMVLGPAALLITSVAVGLACLVTAAAIAVPCYLGILLMKAVFAGCLGALAEVSDCCFGPRY